MSGVRVAAMHAVADNCASTVLIVYCCLIALLQEETGMYITGEKPKDKPAQ